MNKSNDTEANYLNEIFDQLFPIARSIAGPAIRKSLKILQKHIPLTIEQFKTNEKILDWTVPQEWMVEDCKLIDPSGKLIIDIKNSNLHVLNYSEPFKGKIRLELLLKNVYTNKHMPDAIPYITSYYKPRWGICMSENQKKNLKEGVYDLNIKTKKYDGFLDIGVANLEGKSKKCIMLTSYICHPSMANNELSGPLGLILLYKKIKKMKSRNFSYKFLINPETIGSIAYLSRYSKELLKNLEGGIVINCLGGPSKKLKIKKTRKSWLGENTLIDRLACNLEQFYPCTFETRDFTPISGSDERQYCSPGFNLPFNQISRTTYLEYPEYHTDMDNKKFMRIKNVQDSVNKIFSLIEALEYSNRKLKNNFPYGEPFLSKNGLYNTISDFDGFSITENKSIYTEKDLIMIILSLADNFTLFDISKKINICILDLIHPLKKLIKKKIINII